MTVEASVIVLYHSWFTLALVTHRYYYLKEMGFENIFLPRVGRYR